MKVSELTISQLNWAVAKARGWIDYPTDSIEQGQYWHTEPDKAPHDFTLHKSEYSPTTDLSQAFVIIHQELRKGMILFGGDGVGEDGFCAQYLDGNWYEGPTLLIAVMRCYVAKYLGDEVDVNELMMLGD